MIVSPVDLLHAMVVQISRHIGLTWTGGRPGGLRTIMYYTIIYILSYTYNIIIA